MKRKLIPRVTLEAAEARLAEIQSSLRQGADPGSLPVAALEFATINPTGGEAPNQADVVRWREQVLAIVGEVYQPGLTDALLGKALSEALDPSPGDVAHPETWSYLSLWIFPDLVAARWPLTSGALTRDRWLGAHGAGRDRSHLKTCWRRWQLFDELLLEGERPLGEDELVNLTERSALARNERLVRSAARQVLAYAGPDRMNFTRELLKRLTYRTGPLVLDCLDDEELEAVVRGATQEVAAHRGPRRAML